MALIPCPNCGNQISDRAQQCPACGYRPHDEVAPKKRGGWNPAVIIIAIALVVGIAVGLYYVLGRDGGGLSLFGDKAELSQSYLDTKGRWQIASNGQIYYIQNPSENTCKYYNSNTALIFALIWAPDIQGMFFEGKLECADKVNETEPSDSTEVARQPSIEIDPYCNEIIFITTDQSGVDSEWKIPIVPNRLYFHPKVEVLSQDVYGEFLQALQHSQSFSIKVPLSNGETETFKFMNDGLQQALDDYGAALKSSK